MLVSLPLHSKNTFMSQHWNPIRDKEKRMSKEPERAVLVALIKEVDTPELVNEHLDELEFLAETAGAVTIKKFIQRMKHPDQKQFVGKGKLQEIKEYIKENDIELAIFDDDLSGKQALNLEEELKVKIVDRSSLILDIFASRARTAQSKTQVELAQLQYMLPRLRGMWTHLERQRGGIGMRGPGEQEIETDRRIIRDKISLIKKKLEKIDLQNQTRRKSRQNMVRVALVGYTNAGKSTLMNLLSKSDIFAEDKLFATLDTTVRKVVFDRMPFLLSDTVGFIRKLPHHLVESFKSTLDEVLESDLLIHVIDMSHPQYEDQISVVIKTLQELGAEDKEVIMVLNKVDLFKKRNFDKYLEGEIKEQIITDAILQAEEKYACDVIVISAKEKEGITELKQAITDKVSHLYTDRYPYLVKHW
jgi:GTP-binding protein HflX